MLTLGILAHVDAGKTSLTERLLLATGAIDELGSVDEGSTQTDTLALERELPSLTRGEGVVESAFDHYQPVRGPAPDRPPWDHNPLNRKEYLLHVQRRV
jgi:translation elongation factor EF-G